MTTKTTHQNITLYPEDNSLLANLCGLFDENFFIWFEDFELCRRIRERKKSTIQIFEAKAYHVHGQRKSIKNPLKKTFIENYFLQALFDNAYL